VTALDAYFRGEVHAVDAIDVDPDGTSFQRRVWAALRTIPVGETTSYGAIARALGMPTASRAVGAANGANPIWIVVPCHRVIGASGALTGYAGGLDVKRRLLAHEREAVTPSKQMVLAGLDGVAT
jgi:methylated-DNA-[protein]-cysteine S-methyltransferase